MPRSLPLTASAPHLRAPSRPLTRLPLARLSLSRLSLPALPLARLSLSRLSLSALSLAALSFTACSRPAAPAPRAELHLASGEVSVIPTPGQLPFCLLIEVRGSISVRPLASSEEGQSLPCPAGKPIASRAFPLSTKGTRPRLYVVFSDRELKADTIAQQLTDRLTESPTAPITSMDLRAPGQVSLEILDIPAVDSPPPK